MFNLDRGWLKRRWLSYAWLALKVAAVWLLAGADGARFIYQNF